MSHHTIVGVGGYLSLVPMWEEFEGGWTDLLHDAGIEYWRQSLFAHSAKQFKGWDEDESLRRERLARALRVINQNVLASACVPYGMAARMVWLEIAGLLDAMGVEGSIAYVFESGAEGAGQIAAAFNDLHRSPGHAQDLRLLSLKFEDKRRFLPLQAADVLAYELAQQLAKDMGINTRPRREWILSTLATVPTYWTYPKRSNLRTWSRVMEVVASLSKDQLDRRPATMREATVPVTVAEFQQRWRWFRRFRGAVLEAQSRELIT